MLQKRPFQVKRHKFVPVHSVKEHNGEQKYRPIHSYLYTNRGGWLTSRPGRFTPGEESRYPLNGSRVGPRAGLGVLEKRKFLARVGNRKPDSPLRTAVTALYWSNCTIIVTLLCGSQKKKQRLFPNTALTDWSLGAFVKLRILTIRSVRLSAWNNSAPTALFSW